MAIHIRGSVGSFTRMAFGCVVLLIAAGLASARSWQDGAIVQPVEGSQSMQLTVGSSRVLAAPWPVSRVSIGNPEVADVEVLTPTRVLVSANSIGSTDLIMWNETEDVWQARLNVVVDLAYVSEELSRLFPTANLTVTQSRDLVVVSGLLRRLEDVAQLRALLDAYEIKYVDATSVAGVHQVQLHIRLAEVSRQAIRALTLNFVYDGNDFVGSSLIGPDGGQPLISPDFLTGEIAFSSATSLVGLFPNADLSLFLQALAENQYVRILAEPTLVALSGEEASFLAGGEFPIPVVQGGAGTDSNTAITIEWKEFGVRLAFRPTVLGDNTIRLLVAPEVSDLSTFGAVEIQGFRIPSVLTRRSQTTLELKSGQTFAMAGLLNSSVSARNSRVPLLGDLPILGSLFRSVRYTRGETELVVLVTASLVEPSSIATNQLLPGDTYEPPNDWEFYIDGKLEGRAPALSSADAAWLRDMGLHRLEGPGAWATHDQPPAVSESVAASNEPMPEVPHSMPEPSEFTNAANAAEIAEQTQGQ